MPLPFQAFLLLFGRKRKGVKCKQGLILIMKTVLIGKVIYIYARLLIWLLHWKLHACERRIANVVLIHGVPVIEKVTRLDRTGVVRGHGW